MIVLPIAEIEQTPYTKTVIAERCPLHSHSFFEFSICCEGEYTNIINGKPLTVSKGRVLLLRPQDEHCFINGKNHRHKDVYITIEKMQDICKTIDDSLFEIITKTPLVINFLLPSNKLSALEINLNFFNDILDKSPLLVETKYISLITELLYNWQENYTMNQLHYPDWLYTLLNNLNSNQFLCKNIDEITKSTNYSHGHVCREFKKYMNISLKNYVSDLKFAYACTLLLDKVNTLTSIANELNYQSTSNFLIAFKNKYGISPSQWRNKRS